MIKDLGFFFFSQSLMGLAPFLQTAFWPSGFLICAGLELSPREGQLKGIVLFSFVSLFLLFLLFFMMWSFFFFFQPLLLVLCFKNSTVHICLKRIEDAHFFLHLVTYACNTLMYLKKKMKKKNLDLSLSSFPSAHFGDLEKCSVFLYPIQNVRVLWKIGVLYLFLMF